MFCKSCGTELHPGKETCPYCGKTKELPAPDSENSASRTKKAKLTRDKTVSTNLSTLYPIFLFILAGVFVCCFLITTMGNANSRKTADKPAITPTTLAAKSYSAQLLSAKTQSLDECIAFLDSTFSSSLKKDDGDYALTLDGNNLLLNIRSVSLTKAIAEASKTENIPQSWYSYVETMLKLQNSAQDYLSVNGHSNISFIVNIVNNDAPDRYLLSLASGKVIYSVLPTEDFSDATTEGLPFKVSSDTANLKIGEIVKDGSFYLGLSAVRATDAIYTPFDWDTTEIASGQEAIYILLEMYNDSEKIQSYSKNISVYADSVKASDPGTMTLVAIDGYQEYKATQLDPGMKLLYVEAFLVPTGWKELTVFAGDYSWKVSASEVLRTPYNYSTLFPVNAPPEMTAYSAGDVIFNSDYTVIYDGCKDYIYNNIVSGDHYYAVFKFTIKNTSNETMDYDLVGYNMRGYQDLRLLDSATYTLNDNIDGYTNIYDIEELKPGMSAKAFVAFKTSTPGGLYTCAFDTGYITNNLLAYVSS